MNRRSFIRTITASGVSLFLPKIIQPIRWKREHEGIYASDFVSGAEAFKGTSGYIYVIDESDFFMRFEQDTPFSISAFSKPFKHHTAQ